MSQRRVRLALLLASIVGFSAAAPQAVQAETRWWDGGTVDIVTNGNGVSAGTDGNWDTTILNWDQGLSLPHVAWNNFNNDTAVFGGTAGTVTLTTGITVGGLQFDTAGYTVTGDTLTFGAAGDILTNADATISSILAGTVAVNKTGTGTLTLSGANAWTGATTISGGTVKLGSSTALSTSSSVTVNSGTFLDTNGVAASVKQLLGTGTVTNTGAAATLTVNGASHTISTTLTGALNLSFQGANTTFTLNTPATYTGSTTIGTGGTAATKLVLGGNNYLPSGTAVFADGSGANVVLDLQGFNQTIAGLTLGSNNGGSATSVTGSGGSTLTLNGNVTVLSHNNGAGAITTPFLNLNGATRTFTVAGNNASNFLTVTSVIQNGGLILTGGAASPFNLSGASTFTGPVSITGGVLVVPSISNVANPNPLGQSSAAASNLLLGTGTTLKYTGTGGSSDRSFTINGTAAGNSASLDAAGAGLLNLTNTASPAYGTVDQTRTLTLTGVGTGQLAANIANNGTGAVTVSKTGTGSWTLTGTNTYTGNTTVSAGTLIGLAGGGSTGSAVTVNNTLGATLGVRVDDNTKQWTASALTSAGVNSNLLFGFTTAPSTTLAPLSVTNNVTFTGTPNVVVDPTNLSAGNTYPLLVVGGTAPAAVPAVNFVGHNTVGTLAWGGTGNKTLFLTVTSIDAAAPIKWGTDANGTWDINATANWKDASATATKYLEGISAGDAVVFDDTYVTALRTVTLNTVVKPASVVADSNLGYTISGTGAIAGSGSFTKSGSGVLTISTANNTYSGGFTLNAGQVGGLPASGTYTGFGTGTLTLNGGAIRGVNTTSAVIIPNNIVWNSTVGWGRASGGNPVFTLNGNITLNGSVGTLPQGAAEPYSMTFNGNISEATVGSSLTFVTNSSGHVFTFNGQNTFTGNLNANSKAVVIGGSGYLGGGNYAGAITSGNLTYSSSANQTLGGVISVSSLTKNTSSTSTLTLTGANTYTGPTNVNAGTLLVNNLTDSATGSGAVNIASGAKLGGTGFINGATTVNGAITPGTAGIGTLTINNNVTWNAGNSWIFDLGTAGIDLLNPGSSDLLVISGDLIKGTGDTFTFDFANSGQAGWYKLADWTGSTAFDGSNFAATNLAGGLTPAFSVDVDTSALYVNLTGVVAGASIWQGLSGDNWTAAGSWNGSVPNSATAEAQFTTTGGTVANLDASQTVNKLTFADSTNKNYTISGSGTLSLAGTTPTITTTAGNTGTETLTVALNLGNGTTINANGGTLALNAPNNSVIGTGVTATVASGATLSLGGAGNALSDGTTHVNVTNSGTLAATSAGKRVGNIDGTGNTTVTAASATLTANHVRQAGLSIGTTSTVTVAPNGGNSGVSQVTNLTIGAGGKLDLKDNDLVVKAGSLTRAQVEAMVNSGVLSATGILTTAPSGGIRGLGTAQINETVYSGSYGGLSVSATDTLVKYTYLGDADLSGSVDFDDYAYIDAGYFGGGNRWYQGDFDNNGVVDFDDYAYIDGSYFGQGAPLLTAGSVNAVPEPSTWVLGGLAMLGLAGLRLRRRRLALT